MAGYRDQVALLIEIVPEIEKVKEFVLHGGTAINLFLREMPRLSVDIDLTYVSTEGREKAITNIQNGLAKIEKNIQQHISGVKTNFLKDQLKIQISKAGALVKIEVNQGIRGLLGLPVELVLCEKAQESFDAFCAMPGVPVGQLYGGKICAALDRQHPRDLFDVSYILKNEGFTEEIKQGFLFTVLSSKRSLYEILFPNKLDQKATFINQFVGMTDEPFTYADFETTRELLIKTIQESITEEDKEFLINFKEGLPGWNHFDFSSFPSVQWKLKNILSLKEKNPDKHRALVNRLVKALEGYRDTNS